MSKKSFFSILCGLFLLTATQANAQGTSWQEATLLTGGQNVSASIEAAGVEHWYKFTVDEKAAVEFIIQTDNVLRIGYMNLYAANGEEIADVRRNYVYFASYTGTFRIINLPAGTYYLNVQRYTDYGSYTMSFNLTPGPKAEYSFIQNLNVISFESHSQYADSLTWNYGNGVSEFGNHQNPQYAYSQPGYYPVRLIAFNRAFNMSDTMTHYVSVRSIQRVESNRGGNGGKVTISIIGGGMRTSSQAKLRRGTTEIAALETCLINPGKMEATFNLAGVELGLYDVVVQNPDEPEISLADAFTVDEESEPNVWLDIQGTQQVITGRTATYTVLYGNTGNTDAQNRIIWIVTPDDPAEITFTDIDLNVKPYIKSTDLDPAATPARYYGIFVPVIPANLEKSFTFKVKSAEDFEIRVFHTYRYLEDELASDGQPSIAEDFNDCLTAQCEFDEQCGKFRHRGDKKLAVAVRNSFDEFNGKQGPSGYCEENFVAQRVFPYTIFFENKDTDAAREVVITDALDAQKFDLSTFRFKELGFGGNRYTVYQDDNRFANNIDLRPDKNAIVRITGVLEDNVATWRFLTFDPRRMKLTEDIDAGFLPPNVTSPEGEGFVSFVVNLKETIGNGDIISNFADIFFDANDPVRTNVFSNKIDEIAPVSKVESATTNYLTQEIELTFSGTDAGGAGIKYYDLYVSTNGGEFVQMFKSIQDNTFSYLPAGAGTYSFYTLSTDNLDNRENAKSEAEASLNYLGIKSVEMNTLRIYPNPVKNELFIDSNSPITKAEIYSITGALLLSESNVSNKLNVSTLAQGMYLLKIYTGNGVAVKKVVVE